MQVDPSRSDTVYASTGAVYKSTDSGSSWTGVKNDQALFLSVSPTDPATIYAVLSSSLTKSADGGHSWLYTATGLSAYLSAYYGGGTSLAEDPANGDTVYLGTGFAGLYRVAPDSSKTRISPERMRALAKKRVNQALRSSTAAASLLVPVSIYNRR